MCCVFTESTHRPIQSLIRYVRGCGLCVPSIADRNQGSWRLLVEERIAKIEKTKNPLFGEGFDFLGGFEEEDGFWFQSW